MSGLISSLFEPVVRQARRFSQQSDRPPQPPSDDDQASFLPGALGKSTSPTYNYNGKEGGIMSVHEDTEPRLDSGFARSGNSPAILPISSLLNPSSRRHETDDFLRPTWNGHGTEDAPTEVSVSHSGSPRGFDQNSGPLTPGLAGNTQQSDAATSTQNVVREISSGVPRSETPAAGNSFDDLDGQFQLPADDGMGVLRRKIHAIRDLGSSSADKARMIHDLMTERYNASRGDYSNEALSPSSPRSPEQPETPPFRWSNQSFDQLLMTPASIASIYQPNNPFNLNFEDLKPTFAPKALEPDSPVGDEGKDIEEFEDDCLGCQHYKRNVKLQCYTCKRWYTCRFCHDEVEDHHLNRRKTENMLCMLCGHAQAAAQCCQECGKQAAQYYCNVCKLWDNDSEKSIYHCNDCGICRIGQGLGKDFFHCKTCSVCLPISIENTHRCIERSTQCDCPICGDYMFTSPETVVVMRCGHSIHHKCLSEYSKSSSRCPICSKTITNMESTFRNLDRAIQNQPMPAEFKDTKALVYCNDCSAKSVVKYHWLGLRCDLCESYNTAQIRLLHGDVLESLEQNDNTSGILSSRYRSSSYSADEELSPTLASLRINTSSVPGPSLISQLSAASSAGQNGSSYNLARGRAVSPVISNYFGLPTERDSEKPKSSSFFGGQAQKDAGDDTGGELRLWGTKLRYRYGFLDRETDPVDEASEADGEEDESEASEDSDLDEDEDVEDDDDDESIDIFGHR